MKINYINGIGLRLTTENAVDLVRLGAIGARLNLKDYQSECGKDHRCIDVPLEDVLKVLTGEKK